MTVDGKFGPESTKALQKKLGVTADGLFEYEGSTFKSLTAVARQITGTHWSGPLFFGLTGKAGAQ